MKTKPSKLHTKLLIVAALVCAFVVALVTFHKIFFLKTEEYTIFEPANKEFTISYPSDWKTVEIEDGKDRYWSSFEIEKNNAHFKATWGDGLGGACPEELNPEEVVLNNITVQCHYVSDGIEYWRLGHSENIKSFVVNAWSNSDSQSEKDDIIYILSNIQKK